MRPQSCEVTFVKWMRLSAPSVLRPLCQDVLGCRSHFEEVRAPGHRHAPMTIVYASANPAGEVRALPLKLACPGLHFRATVTLGPSVDFLRATDAGDQQMSCEPESSVVPFCRSPWGSAHSQAARHAGPGRETSRGEIACSSLPAQRIASAST